MEFYDIPSIKFESIIVKILPILSRALFFHTSQHLYPGEEDMPSPTLDTFGKLLF